MAFAGLKKQINKANQVSFGSSSAPFVASCIDRFYAFHCDLDLGLCTEYI